MLVLVIKSLLMEQLKYNLPNYLQTYENTVSWFSLKTLQDELQSLTFFFNNRATRDERVELRLKIQMVEQRIKILQPQEEVQSKVWNIMYVLFGSKQQKVWQY